MTSPARRPEPDPPSAPQVYDEGPSYVGPMSYAEYRRMDEESEMRLEYVGGVVYAMSGGTRTHSHIATNLLLHLGPACVGTGCSAHGQGFKVRTPRGDEYVPDAFVECDPPNARPVLYSEAPCLIVEVLSPSTARQDFNEKRPAYQEIPTLGAYLIVAAEWRGGVARRAPPLARPVRGVAAGADRWRGEHPTALPSRRRAHPRPDLRASRAAE